MRVIVQFSGLNFCCRGTVGVLASQDSNDVILLYRYAKGFENVLFSSLHPNGGIEQVNHSFLEGGLKFLLFDFVFDFHFTQGRLRHFAGVLLITN